MQISFQIKKSKINKKGLVPIYMRVTIDGNRLELSTNRRINPSLWDSNLCQALGTSDETVILNNYLNSLRTKVQ